MPFNTLVEWLKIEKMLGVDQPNCAVLATSTANGLPHTRVVAIREIETESLLFFTQKRTRKVNELLSNPHASMNFLLAMQQRQVILEGTAKPLSQEENKSFWHSLPRERQLRFSVYALSSEETIQDVHALKKKESELSKQFIDKQIPMNESYCGFRFTPETFVFYTANAHSFSEVIKWFKKNNVWHQE